MLITLLQHVARACNVDVLGARDKEVLQNQNTCFAVGGKTCRPRRRGQCYPDHVLHKNRFVYVHRSLDRKPPRGNRPTSSIVSTPGSGSLTGPFAAYPVARAPFDRRAGEEVTKTCIAAR